uniref:Uncharacterized protein n=1 Tax=Oryza brachyantha TaxID=4533 RepID=J3KZV8_ORYBR
MVWRGIVEQQCMVWVVLRADLGVFAMEGKLLLASNTLIDFAVPRSKKIAIRSYCFGMPMYSWVYIMIY